MFHLDDLLLSISLLQEFNHISTHLNYPILKMKREEKVKAMLEESLKGTQWMFQEEKNEYPDPYPEIRKESV
jgi:hypothetical protein